MTEESEANNGALPNKSYRSCTACGCKVHQSCDSCPECGAFPDEIRAPAANKTITLTLSLLLGIILLLALFALSQNRDAAARAEQEKFSRLKRIAVAEPVQRPKAPETPIPTVVALQPPTPTPLPITPTGPAPEPTPIPRTHPTAVTTAIATPAPTPRASSTLELKNQLAENYRNEIDEKFPIAKENEYIQLTLQNNRSISGTITRMETNRLALKTTAGQRWVVYRELSRQSRMRVDQSERDAWAEEEALKEVLKGLQN